MTDRFEQGSNDCSGAWFHPKIRVESARLRGDSLAYSKEWLSKLLINRTEFTISWIESHLSAPKSSQDLRQCVIYECTVHSYRVVVDSFQCRFTTFYFVSRSNTGHRACCVDRFLWGYRVQRRVLVPFSCVLPVRWESLKSVGNLSANLTMQTA